MKTLNKPELLEYIRHAIKLEEATIEQKQIISQYDSAALAHKPQFVPDDKPVMPKVERKKSSGLLVAVVSCLLIGLILLHFAVNQSSVVADREASFLKKNRQYSSVEEYLSQFERYYQYGGGWVYVSKDHNPMFDDDPGLRHDGYLEYDAERYLDAKKAQRNLWIATAVFLLPGLVMLFVFLLIAHQENVTINAVSKNYRTRVEEIERKNAEREAAYKRRLTEHRQNYDTSMQCLNSHLSESNSVLAKFYEADVIFPKYRNLPALTSIYEYLASGRCEELAGPNGAYNLYESEIRQNMVISQLSEVVSNLESIRANQFMLYQEVNQINANVNAIGAEVQQLAVQSVLLTQLTALNTYYSGISAVNTTAMQFLGTV